MAADQRVLVTGGAGFIGSHLVEALLDEGYDVRVLDDLSTGHRTNLAHVEGRYEFLEGSVGRFRGLPARGRRRLLRLPRGRDPQRAPVGPRAAAFPRERPDGHDNVLEAARQAGVRRFMFAASSSAYGDTEELPKHEGMLPRPLSPYAAGKLAGEYYVAVYAKTMGLDGVSLRYFNVFGPRQDPSSPYSGVISKFATVMAQGQRPLIFGDGGQTRDFTYVDNVVAANLAAMRSARPLGGEAVNLGTGGRVSLLELVAAINRVLGTDLQPTFEPGRAGDVRDSQAALDRIKALIGYEPTVEFEGRVASDAGDDCVMPRRGRLPGRRPMLLPQPRRGGSD